MFIDRHGPVRLMNPTLDNRGPHELLYTEDFRPGNHADSRA